ncbi:MAG: tRNA uridine-5-carboxymethylaminomethyl(34) synthesis GTPase MnmE [Gammaproteobacteria bacterium]|nr:tRNA uridine-5-carboxymethylaminomethyl(34) synthesis GTPase MnmE [Pseudomonadales bacterium]
MTDTDTIAAIATPPGRSGVGIVRVSGPLCTGIARQILGFDPPPRKACYSEFLANNSVIDKGIALYFQAPNSFTGEDVLELQGHGGVFVLNDLLKATLDLGCRIARPGEFSERAFLNGKMDLTQVEAISDLINASTEQAARSAVRTLEGAFSDRINELVSAITELRIFLEAAIDFSDEDIDFIEDGKTVEKLHHIIERTEAVFKQARLGTILQEGIKVAIAGRPNAGKSSLLNALSGRDSAIVTAIPGTTRDTLRELIDIDGIPTHIIDTAGLRNSDDVVEQEGVKRARAVIEEADLVLLVIDSQSLACNDNHLESLFQETRLPESVLINNRLLVIFNKTDLLADRQFQLPGQVTVSGSIVDAVPVSAKTGAGLESLREKLKSAVGYSTSEEGSFMARERQLQALGRAREFLDSALLQLQARNHLELVAEDLRQAQQNLGEITGQVTSDELLGQIFSSFCIGK